MTVCFKFKQGDTFDMTTSDPVVILDPQGDPHDLTSATIAAAVWFPSTDEFFDLTAAWVDISTDRYIRLTALPAVTATWPLGTAHLDVQITFAGGDVHSSDTAQFIVTKDIAGAA